MPTTAEAVAEALAGWRTADTIMVCLTSFIAVLTFFTFWLTCRIKRLTAEVRSYARDTLVAAKDTLAAGNASREVAKQSLDFFMLPRVSFKPSLSHPSVELGQDVHATLQNDSAQAIRIDSREAMTIVIESDSPEMAAALDATTGAVFSVLGRDYVGFPVKVESPSFFAIPVSIGRRQDHGPGPLPDTGQIR